MTNPDTIQIHFSQSQGLFLQLCLGFLMFGVALELHWRDFAYMLQKPKLVAAGLFSQWVLLPVLTLSLVWLFSPPVSLAMGMLLIAACPGGNVSNYAVHLAGANIALSVVLTSISTLACALVTPFLFQLMTQLSGLKGHLTDIHIDFLSMVQTLAILVFLPILVANILHYLSPDFVKKIRPVVKTGSLLLFFGFVVAGVIGNLDNLVQHLPLVFWWVLLHNGLALLVGYVWSAYILRQPFSTAVSISLETGIQNSGLALLLVFAFFQGNGGMALLAAWWSIWHLISALAVAMLARKRKLV